MFELNKPTYLYLHEHAIWYWTTIKTKSCVSIVNDKYTYEVFNKVTGNSIYKGIKDTLIEAKKEVFEIVEYGNLERKL